MMFPYSTQKHSSGSRLVVIMTNEAVSIFTLDCLTVEASGGHLKKSCSNKCYLMAEKADIYTLGPCMPFLLP